MITADTYTQLLTLLGDEEKAKAVIQLMDRRVTTADLTPKQQVVYDYFVAGKPVITMRQVAAATGCEHPQKLAAILSALAMKKYLVPIDK